MNKPTLTHLILGIVILTLSAGLLAHFIFQKPQAHELIEPTIDIDIKILVNEFDKYNGWINKTPGWYNPYTGNKVVWYTDTMIPQPKERNTQVLLVTEDSTPSFIISSDDSSYSVNTMIVNKNSLPLRSIYDHRKRIYMVTFIYNLTNIHPYNILMIKADYGDVKYPFNIGFDPSINGSGYE